MKNFLNPEDRAVLREMHLDSQEKRLADRMKAILLLDDGYSYAEIAKILMLDDSTIRRHEKMYCEKGLDRLLCPDYPGYDGKLSCEQREELKRHLREHFMRTAKEIAVWVKETFHKDYTPEGLVHLLHQIGFSYKQTRAVLPKANPEKQKEFIRDYEGLKDFLGLKDRIYFGDGMHPHHNAMSARGWIEKGSNKEIPTNTGRERMNLNGVLCLNTPDGPEIIVREEERINGPAMVELLKEIEEKNPEAERIVLILDNAPYNRSKRVKEYLETSKVEVWYLPPYSPNLNLIERLWKFLRAKVMRGYYYEKFAVFQAAVRGFFAKAATLYRDELKRLLTENFQLVNSS